jgi:hypothetical protein
VFVCVGALCFAGRARAESNGGQSHDREVIFASETVGAPPGYHPDTQLRYGPLIGGAIATGLGMLMVGAGVADLQKSDDSGPAFIMLGGAQMAVGVSLLAYGLLVPRDVYVRDPVPRATVGIAPTKQGLTLTLSAVF